MKFFTKNDAANFPAQLAQFERALDEAPEILRGWLEDLRNRLEKNGVDVGIPSTSLAVLVSADNAPERPWGPTCNAAMITRGAQIAALAGKLAYVERRIYQAVSDEEKLQLDKAALDKLFG